MAALAPAQIDAYRRDGFLVASGAARPADFAAMRAELDAWVEDSRARTENYGETRMGTPRFDLEPGHDAANARLRRVNNPAEISETYRAVAFDGPLADMASDLLGPDIKFLHGKINLKLPGTATRVDFTEENGATRLVPGSHLSGLDPDPATPHRVPTVVAEAPSGTALAWDGRTWHAAGINRARAPRYGVQTSFCGPQFRQMENYTLGTRPEVLAELTPEEKALLGFRIWSGYGNTGDAGAGFAEPGTRAVGELRD